MKKLLIPVFILGMITGGCSLIEPKGNGQDSSAHRDNPTHGKTVLGKNEPLPPNVIVLPAEGVAVETSEVILPDTETIEITELESEPASSPAEQAEIRLPDNTVADGGTETVIIPAEDSPAPQTQTGSADTIQVEILNASGIPGLEQRVSERLADKNYAISWAEEGKGTAPSALNETWIKYRPDLARQAVRLGHILPGNQIVIRDKDLPEGVDIRIIVGSDQQ